MKELLKNLSISVKHLSLLDKAFESYYPPYASISKKMLNLPLHDELLKEIYVGGKKGHAYARQMILADILQYIFMGRGYYFAVKGPEQKIAFISMIMHVCNMLILMEDASVDVKLRNYMLDTIKKGLGSKLFEDAEQEELYKDLRRYKGRIIPQPKEGKEYDNVFDSFFPKRVGAVSELLVYAHLIRKSYGYVVSLLHSQRLMGNQKPPHIAPPDFLLLRSKGEIFGIEVGTGKESQSGFFSTLTSIPVFTARLGSFDQPQPFRCGKCLKWIIYCDEVIRICSENKEHNNQYIDCKNCTIFKHNLDDALAKCPNIVYYGRASNYRGEIKTLRYHYDCVKKDPEVKKVLSRAKTAKRIAPIPWVSGLDNLSIEK